MAAVVIAALCLFALIGLATYLTLDLASEQIAGAFRDALAAFRDALRP